MILHPWNTRSRDSCRTGGGQADPTTGQRHIDAPGAFLINILACCDGDIEDVIQGAQWASKKISTGLIF